MRSVSFADKATGLFIGRTFTTCDADMVAAQTPDGCIAVDGIHDHLSKRFDFETGLIVDYQPPQPSANHVWDDSSRRWKLTDDAQKSADNVAAAIDAINALESKQHRAMRELALGDSSASARIREIDSQIAEHREVLKRSI